MLICQHNAEYPENDSDEQDCDWSQAARAYSNVLELPSFVEQQRRDYDPKSVCTTADPGRLQGRQLEAYNTVCEHFEAKAEAHRISKPLRMVVSGTAGTGKSYLIQCLKLLLKDKLYIAAPTGAAAYNVDGYTLHTLLSLPVKGEFKPLEGSRLQMIQEMLSGVEYIIVDEMSMIGRKVFGQVDRRLRQVFPHLSEEVLGGCSCLLIGDWGQLPPVMDLPLYTTVSRTELSDLGSANYHLFDRAVVLDRVMRQAGKDAGQELFRDLLLRLRNAESTEDDWRHLMKRTPAEVGDVSAFDEALRLYPTARAVAEYNASKLRANGQPIAVIKAIHTGPDASKATSEDAGGLEPVVCLAHGARVMLSANLWVETGLVNGALGTAVAICYESGKHPPDLPVAVNVKFDSYSGPTLPDGTVPISPLRRTWFSTTRQCSRLQLPLKLSWAITIHKSQGMTLDKVVVDIGKKEFSTGLTFVACSRVRRLSDLLFVSPFTFQRLANLRKSQRLKERRQEDARLERLYNTRQQAGSVPASADNPLPAPQPPQLPPQAQSCSGDGSRRVDTIEDDDPDLIIEGCETLPLCSRKYRPVDEDWRRRTCQSLGLSYCGPNEIAPGGPEVCLTVPASIKCINGDGNCFYRAISYVITGSQSQHSAVRRAIVDHMRAIGDRLIASGRIEQYIADNAVERSGTWATDTEINAASHLLKTSIYIYMEDSDVWQHFHPRVIDRALRRSEVSDLSMYINNPHNHFEVVQSVMPCDRCHSSNNTPAPPQTATAEPTLAVNSIPDPNPLSNGPAALPPTLLPVSTGETALPQVPLHEAALPQPPYGAAAPPLSLLPSGVTALPTTENALPPSPLPEDHLPGNSAAVVSSSPPPMPRHRSSSASPQPHSQPSYSASPSHGHSPRRSCSLPPTL